ncbi:MAG: hypothetical protein WCT27_02810 [Patescibacteria group bacterium]|jgi:hypothetical protein
MTKQNKLQQINKLVETAHVSLENARQLLRSMVGNDEDVSTDVTDKAKEVGKVVASGNEKIIEGVFDGQNMIGPDGKQYSIPANYASKSKLVQGDTLKLTIMADGSFMYKQIGPVDRNRLVGMLARDEATDEYRAIVGDKSYKVLLASITYFKGEPGDEVVILTPKDAESVWAAVENIIKIPADGIAAEPVANAKSAPAVEEIEELSA